MLISRNIQLFGSLPKKHLISKVDVLSTITSTAGTSRTKYTGKRAFSRTVSMSLKTGIVGLPNVGKSTLFNSIVEGGKAQAENFPFCTIDPNIGLVSVPDPRLKELSRISQSQATIPTAIEFVDIAGLVKGASKGEGLGNKFLSNIREVDAILQVVRCFDDANVVHVEGRVDALDDTEVINLELALSDLGQIEKRLQKLQKNRGRTKEEMKAAEIEVTALHKLVEELEDGRPARSVNLTKEETEQVKSLNLLTMKPMIYAANINEADLSDNGASNPNVKTLRHLAAAEGAETVLISAKVQEELNQLSEDEAKEFLQSLGAMESGLDSLIRATYKLLGLRTYFTSGEKETRAWTIRAGMSAPQAAGVIHSDFERGFIRAETASYEDFVKHSGFKGCQTAGVLRLEGKDYIVQEGDVMLFRKPKKSRGWSDEENQKPILDSEPSETPKEVASQMDVSIDYNNLEKAAREVYFNGTSLKLAARKWKVTLSSLKYFCENEADWGTIFGHSDESLEDP